MLLLYDLTSGEVEIDRIDCDSLEIESLIKIDISEYAEADSLVKRVAVDERGHVHFAVSHTSKVIDIDLNTREYSADTVPVNDIFGLFYVNGSFFITSYDRSGVFWWDGKEDCRLLTVNGADNECHPAILINRVLDIGGVTCAVSASGIHGYEMGSDSLKEVVKVNGMVEQEELQNSGNTRLFSVDISNGSLVFLSPSLDKWFVFSQDGSECRCISIGQEIWPAGEPYISQKNTLTEKKFITEGPVSLDDFLTAVIRG